ncbi:hypothetical protein CHLRE_07g317421v5 [Chlamydomonas reinhardtii]|uniref:Uncharacterized protein n=1 Tax=Chlamydomonas reinhardtii TaxID=3055 RepID=A0A2K3DIS5_CHLRE|nr:uncharacterized protein CHLRE_07g317421v5 [Chlamydomonas reinhardtii]PNW80431.1 hypothetical protein CHLRE_07g317421v5 [Chlamydomonas reinhardtii]
MQHLLADVEATVRKLETEAARLAEQVAQLLLQGAADAEHMARLHSEVAGLQASLQEAGAAWVEAEERAAVGDAVAEAARQELAALRQQVEQLCEELSAAIEQRDSESAAKTGAQEAASRAEAAAAAVQQEAGTLREQVASLQQQLAAAEAHAGESLQRLQAVAADLDKQLCSEQELTSALQQQADALAAELAAAKALAEQLESELATARAEVAVAVERAQDLETAASMAANQEAADVRGVHALADQQAAELGATHSGWVHECEMLRGMIVEREAQISQLQAELEATSQGVLLQAADAPQPPQLAGPHQDQDQGDAAADSPHTPARKQVAVANSNEEQQQLQLQDAALQQLVADCATLREQRDAALAQLAAAAAALDVAEVGARELMMDKEQLEVCMARESCRGCSASSSPGPKQTRRRSRRLHSSRQWARARQPVPRHRPPAA